MDKSIKNNWNLLNIYTKYLPKVCPVCTSNSSRFSKESFSKWDKCYLVVITENRARKFRDSFSIISYIQQHLLAWKSGIKSCKKWNISKARHKQKKILELFFFPDLWFLSCKKKFWDLTISAQVKCCQKWREDEYFKNLENRIFIFRSYLSKYLTFLYLFIYSFH